MLLSTALIFSIYSLLLYVSSGNRVPNLPPFSRFAFEIEIASIMYVAVMYAMNVHNRSKGRVITGPK